MSVFLAKRIARHEGFPTRSTTMSALKTAIDQIRETRAKVYADDPDQFVCDANSVKEAARDHTDRWLYELIQNCDDAFAKSVCVHIAGATLYVADDGRGLTPAAVKSLSKTHFPVKSAGAIGRK